MKKFPALIFFAAIACKCLSQITGTFTDPRDGHIYSYIVIGNQTWMSENLDFPTPESWCYGNNKENCDKFGRLYTWKAASTACPDSWHLPGDEEWKDLEQFLGMTREETNIFLYRGERTGTKLKSRDAWSNCDTSDCNSTGFSALPAGYRMYTDGSFTGLNENARWWTSTTGVWDGVTYGIRRCIYSDQTGIDRDAATMTLGFSVRCIRDAPLPSE